MNLEILFKKQYLFDHMSSVEIAEISENGREGNTEPLGRRKGKKRKISEISQISEVSTQEKKSSNPVAFHWVFTWNNYPKNWKDFFQDRKSLIEKICTGEEICPTTGTKHLQGWLKLYKKNYVITYLNLPKEIHWEVMSRKATERQNTKYCSKVSTSLLHWGIPVPYSINVEKKPWMVELMNILKKEPDFRTIHWIWEENGNSGKTLFMKMAYLELEHVIFINGKGHDIRHCVADFTTRTGNHPKIVLMNIPRVNKDYISYEALENVKDMAFFSGKFEGCVVCGPNPHLMVFANEPPDRTKLSADRWSIGHLKNDQIFWN